METFRTVFYTPVYVAVAGGFLETEGLDVSFSTCPPEYPHPLSALNHGAADIVQSGIMRSIIASDWGAETVPAHFAKINARDGFFVLGSHPTDEFQWEYLQSGPLIIIGFSPMPWVSLQYALKNHGVDVENLEVIRGLQLHEAVETFEQGHADYIHLPQPAAETLLMEGTAHLEVALGAVNGHVAYSSLAATNRFLDREPEMVHSFMRGYCRSLDWLYNNSAETIAEMVSPFFPEVSQELLARSVRRYKDLETWPKEPRLDLPEFDVLQDMLIGAGMVHERQPYEKVVRTEFFDHSSRC